MDASVPGWAGRFPVVPGGALGILASFSQAVEGCAVYSDRYEVNVVTLCPHAPNFTEPRRQATGLLGATLLSAAAQLAGHCEPFQESLPFKRCRDHCASA